MASAFLSSANPFVSSTLSSSSSTISSSSFPASIYPLKDNVKRQIIHCKASSDVSLPSPNLTKRSFSACFITSIFFSLGTASCFNANAAILEADDDEELLERVKKDRKRRLERQGVINSSGKETGYLQDAVYKLSKVGQAIENDDLFTAGSVLGKTTDTNWVRKANLAFNKLSTSPEEKTEVDTFNSSLSSLFSAVIRNDVESSKVAFVALASAFEKWTVLTGLVEQIKGL